MQAANLGGLFISTLNFYMARPPTEEQKRELVIKRRLTFNEKESTTGERTIPGKFSAISDG